MVTCLDGYQMARQGQAGQGARRSRRSARSSPARVATILIALLRAAARGGRAQVRPRRLLLADGARPDRRGRARARLADQGDRDDRPRPAARPHRHRRELGRRALQLRHAGADPTASAFVHRRHGHLRLRGDHPQPASTRRSARSSRKIDHGLLPNWADIKKCIAADPARHGARRRRSASCPAAARCWRRSPPTRSRRRSRRTRRRTSARAPSRASRHRSRRTTPARRRSFIPLLTLGIPSNPVMALMIGAMIIHGIQPGPQVMTRSPQLFWGMIATMWVGNLLLVVLNLPLIGMWVKLLTVPVPLPLPGDPAVLLHRRVQRSTTRRSTST